LDRQAEKNPGGPQTSCFRSSIQSCAHQYEIAHDDSVGFGNMKQARCFCLAKCRRVVTPQFGLIAEEAAKVNPAWFCLTTRKTVKRALRRSKHDVA
jgi:hypothetical protein